MAILDLISQVHLPSSVNVLPKYLKQRTVFRASSETTIETQITCITFPVVWVIAGLHRGMNEIFLLLGRYAAYLGTWLQTFRNTVSVPSSQVKQCLFSDFFLIYFHLPFNLCLWSVLKTPGQDACEILKCGMICQWVLAWSNDVMNLTRGVSGSWQEAKPLTCMCYEV